MIRDDLSNKIVHLVKGNSDDDASRIFLKIIDDERLFGGTGFIKGGHKCICFSEAPLSKFGQILALATEMKLRYRPFGVMVDKKWLFARGGRPVIYQPDDEYSLLCPDQQYRHVRYEPLTDIDFTWEREWRIKVDELVLEPENTTLIVPNRTWERYLIEKHIDDIRMAVVGIGEDALGYVEPYKWHFVSLEDLGVKL